MGPVILITILGIVNVLESEILVFLLETEFWVLFDVLIIILGLVSDYVVVVALFHEDIFFVEIYK